MKNYLVRRYNSNDFSIWNTFVSSAKNATFLFQRDFMEYHSNRFEDYSLLVFDKTQLISVLPANRVGATVFSHQGLTYGGFVFDAKIKLEQVLEIVKSTLQFLNQNNITTFQLKIIPAIYTTFFSEEIEYALFLMNAKLIRRDCLSVLDLTKTFNFTKSRSKDIAKGVRHVLRIKEETKFEQFWNHILLPNLQKKHNSKPVHTAEEMGMLQQKFPNNIRHFNVYADDKIVAGTTVFITDTVAHPQYISGNEQKNEIGSLDFLYNYLITDVFKDKKFFDFGPSHEENGKKINEGILFWKESFGAKTIVQDFYEVKTSNYSLLENIII